MMFDLKVGELHGVINSAAQLRSEIEPFVRDSKLSGLGGHVHYAIDTNIIYLYLNPIEEAEKYGRLFSFDESSTAELLGAAFSKYIFESLATKKNPLYLLIGHDAECRYLYEKLVRKKSSFIDDLPKELERLKLVLLEASELVTEKEKIEYLQENASSIVSYLYLDSSEHTQFDRFNYLLNERKIGRFRSLLSSSGGLSKVNSALTSPHTSTDLVRESLYRNRWEEVLKRTAKSTSRIRADCAALARLQLINEKLPRFEKLALITGDSHLFRAANDVIVEGTGMPFAYEYLRTPRAFLAATDVLNPNVITNSETRNVEQPSTTLRLDLFLNNFITHVSPKSKRTIPDATSEYGQSEFIPFDTVRRIFKNNESIGDEFKKNWKLHTRNLKTAHAFSKTLVQDRLSALISMQELDGIGSTITLLEHQIAEKNEKSWNDFFNSLVVLNVEILKEDQQSILPSSYSVPPLSLDVVGDLGEFVTLLNSTGDIFQLEKSMTDWIERLDRIDSTQYIKYLAFCCYFISKNRTNIAKLLVKRAIQICASVSPSIEFFSERIREKERITTGREAKYLLSVLTRISAEKPADLKDCEVLLREMEFEIDACNLALSSAEDSIDTSIYRYRTNHRVRAERLFVRIRKVFMRIIDLEGTIPGLLDGEREALVSEGEVAELFAIAESIQFEIKQCHHVVEERLSKEIFCTLFTELIFIDAIYKEITSKSVVDAIEEESLSVEQSVTYIRYLSEIYKWNENRFGLTPLRFLYVLLYLKSMQSLQMDPPFRDYLENPEMGYLISISGRDGLSNSVDSWLFSKVETLCGFNEKEY